MKQRGDDADAYFADADYDFGVVHVAVDYDIHARYEPVLNR